MFKFKKMKTSILLITICLFTSCSNTKLTNRPQAIYSNKDSSFVLIGGNAQHFQQRAYYRAKRAAERNKNVVNN